MTSGRLEAFSDGVLAIIITIMVLELRPPDSGSFAGLRDVVPKALAYVLSFVMVGIYWNNHHHLLKVVDRVDGRVLWANLHLLFWLSLVPFCTAWLGEHHEDTAPVVLWASVQLGASIAYYLLVRSLVALHGPDSDLAAAIGRDRKGLVSTAIYVVSIPLAFVLSWLGIAGLVAVAVMWLVPDRRITHALERPHDAPAPPAA